MEVFTYSVDDELRDTTEGVYSFDNYPQDRQLSGPGVEDKRRKRIIFVAVAATLAALTALLIAGGVTAGALITRKTESK